MDHKGFIVEDNAAIEFKNDISEKRKSLPKPKRNSNRGFIVRSDSNPRSFKIGKKVEYKEFRIWPEDVQAMYLKDIANKYPGITTTNIAIMMGCSPITIRGINNKLGNIIPTFDWKNFKAHDEIANRFYTDFDCLEAADEYTKLNRAYHHKGSKNITTDTDKKCSEDEGISIQNMTMTVSCNIDTDNITDFLKSHGYHGQVTLTISKNN